jgi:deazaflavin-dependent oxidoreductase (nitroreductase family)
MSELPLPAWAGYPNRPLRRAINRAPIMLYRLGLGPLIGRLVMIMSTTGRRSGLTRRTALEYHICGGLIYVMSGYGARPDWYQNMLADPRVTLQIGGEVRHARGRRVSDELELHAAYDCFEHSPGLRAMARLLGVELTRESFLANRERFYLVTFDPTDEPTPPPLPADLRWVWLVVLTLTAALCWFRRRGA